MIKTEILVHVQPSLVWTALTDPEQMKKWMNDDNELQLEIEADWNVGGAFTVRGFHHVNFENKGRILEFIPRQKLAYTHLSSLSGLDDHPENHCIIEFSLQEQNGSTLLQLIISNFPTETIYKHLELYWRSTLTILKKTVELHI